MGRVLEKELKPKARWVAGPQDPFIEGDAQKREDQGTDEGERGPGEVLQAKEGAHNML